jgi:hypothetical protein
MGYEGPRQPWASRTTEESAAARGGQVEANSPASPKVPSWAAAGEGFNLESPRTKDPGCRIRGRPAYGHDKLHCLARLPLAGVTTPHPRAEIAKRWGLYAPRTPPTPELGLQRLGVLCVLRAALVGRSDQRERICRSRERGRFGNLGKTIGGGRDYAGWGDVGAGRVGFAGCKDCEGRHLRWPSIEPRRNNPHNRNLYG